jgi:hypothetical protein
VSGIVRISPDSSETIEEAASKLRKRRDISGQLGNYRGSCKQAQEKKNPRWGYEEKTRFSSSTPEISRSK